MVAIAFVQLARRVEKPRPVTQRRRDFIMIAQRYSHALERLCRFLFRSDPRLDRYIVAWFDGAEKPRNNRRRIGRIRCRRIERQAVSRSIRRQYRERATLLIRVDHQPSELLGGFDVGLIKRVNPDTPPSDRRRHLPAEELAAEIVRVREIDL